MLKFMTNVHLLLLSEVYWRQLHSC